MLNVDNEDLIAEQMNESYSINSSIISDNTVLPENKLIAEGIQIHALEGNFPSPPGTEYLGVDSCAGISVLNKKQAFTSWVQGEKSLRTVDGHQIKTEGAGYATIDLMTANGSRLSISVPATFVPQAKTNLISLFSLKEVGFGIDLQKDQL